MAASDKLEFTFLVVPFWKQESQVNLKLDVQMSGLECGKPILANL